MTAQQRAALRQMTQEADADCLYDVGTGFMDTRTSAPKRIQRKRVAGWRMPTNAVYVGRPSRWGNPFTIANALDLGFADNETDARELAVECFDDWLRHGRFGTWWFGNGEDQYEFIVHNVQQELYGKDLACWCSEAQPCHADVLLALAAS